MVHNGTKVRRDLGNEPCATRNPIRHISRVRSRVCMSVNNKPSTNIVRGMSRDVKISIIGIAAGLFFGFGIGWCISIHADDHVSKPVTPQKRCWRI